MHIVQCVATNSFAGTERYAAELARGLAERGHSVTVVGGSRERMESELDGIPWLPGSGLAAAARSLASVVAPSLIHAHLSTAETAAIGVGWARRVPVVSTRHIAKRRGSSTAARFASLGINRRLAAQIAISDFVASAMEVCPDEVLHNGVRSIFAPVRNRERTVLIAQRLEPEKDTVVGVRGWAASGLAELGWTLQVLGDGSQRQMLEEVVAKERIPGVEFPGFVSDIGARMDQAGALLASAPAEPLGLSVLEAMSRALPVIAARGGGHLETLPADYPHVFTPGDVGSAAEALRRFACSDTAALGKALQTRQRQEFDFDAHVEAVCAVYERATRRGPRR